MGLHVCMCLRVCVINFSLKMVVPALLGKELSCHIWSLEFVSWVVAASFSTFLSSPTCSGSLGPAMTRMLARSMLGRSILRPLLRWAV
jgi:short subunit fatty acids transporter